MLEHGLYFLLISFVTAIATAAIRLEDVRQILRETTHFFLTITIGVAGFCVVVYMLEWIFIRPLI